MSQADAMENLRAKYAAMTRLDGMTAQVRGQQFDSWIADLLRAHGINAQEKVRSAGEIDVAFAVGETRYILEAKWQSSKADTGHLAKLQKRLRQRLSGTYGVFVSMQGYTPEALQDLNQGERLEMILIDRAHVEALLAGEISPHDLLSTIRDQASFMGRAYTPMEVVRTSYPRESSKPPADISRFAETASQPSGSSQRLAWDPQQASRGNPSGQYTAFHGYQGVYWVLVVLMLMIALTTSFGVIDGSGLWKLFFAAAVTFEILLAVGFWRLAMQPIRLEIGVAGIQTYFPTCTAWIPWEHVDRVDVIRVDGSPAIVAWSKYASLFPTKGESTLGAFYLPTLKAIAVCPLGPIRAKRHEVAQALHKYGQNRY